MGYKKDKYREVPLSELPDWVMLLSTAEKTAIHEAISLITNAGYNLDDVVDPFDGLHVKTNGQFSEVLKYIAAVVEDAKMYFDEEDRRAGLRQAYSFVRQLDRVFTGISPEQATVRTMQLSAMEGDAEGLMAIVQEMSKVADDGVQGTSLVSTGHNGVYAGRKQQGGRIIRKKPGF